ncbi:MAG: hypothetical protein JW995_06635 [Melioribacteraceae bacterium]|nr:hypothetical protein [Melioribacteraceae bacterium]
MMILKHEDRVDALINQFWKSGYLTISRKHGTFLPAPKPVGSYEIDAVGRYKKAYVFGLILGEREIADPKLLNKIKYLSSRNTKYSNKRIKLFLGVQKHLASKLNSILQELPADNRKNIQIHIIS